MGGFMPTPPAPAQPPQVKLDTTATSRGNFNTFLKNLNGATSLNPPSMAPMVGAAAPTLAPTMSNTDIFDVPQQFLSGGLVQFGNDLMRGLAEPVNEKTRDIPQFLQVIEDSAKERFGVDLGGSSPMGGFNQFGNQLPNMSPTNLFNQLGIQNAQPGDLSMFQPSSPNFQPTQEVGPKDYSMGVARPSYMPMDQDGDGIDQFGAKMPEFETNQGSPMTLDRSTFTTVRPQDAKSAFEQGMSGLRSSAFGAGGSRIAGIGSIGSLFMEEGGSVPPRNTNIKGQPHMLAYITPEEGGILKALGGAGKPGPMGIPSFYEFSDTDSSPAGSFGGDDGGGYGDDNTDYSPPDDDMDYTDPDYGYTTQDTETGQDDMDRATEIGRAVAAAQEAQAAANAQKQAILNQQIKDAAFASQAKQSQLDRANIMSKSTPVMGDLNVPSVTTTQQSLPSAMTGKGGTTGAANIAAASGASLGKDPDRDKSDFSLDLDALANLSKQATKGSFPGLDNIPGTFGAITSMINAATKTGAQNTIDNIEKGFAPTYGPDGQITGTTNYGIGMGQPGGLFGFGTTVPGYQPFDDTSPSMGMYDDNQEIGGNESDPLILKKPIDKKDDEEDEGPTVLPPLGGITPDDREKLPTVVKSPFDPSTATFTPVGFDSGDLNKLIEQITGIRSPVQLQDGGLIRAVDDFLATGT